MHCPENITFASGIADLVGACAPSLELGKLSSNLMGPQMEIREIKCPAAQLSLSACSIWCFIHNTFKTSCQHHEAGIVISVLQM